MDFGIARAMDDIGATMTNTWNVVGTAQYLSPEQATGEVADLRSDIYSVGCLLYELLTGKPPFTGDTPVAIAYQHVSAQLTPPSQVNPELDEGLDTILSVALAKDSRDRYQSAQAMLDDIQLVIEGQPVTTKIARILPKRSKFIMAGAGLTFVALLALAFTFMSGKASGPVIQIPNVVGLTQDQASSLLAGYTINFQHAPDSRIPKDRIASQLPLATARVQKGSSVTLTISDGPGDTTIPANLVNLTLEDARNEITAAGLVIAQIVPVNSSAQPGTIIQVTPSPGTTISAGSGLILQIASGSVQVPTLTGLTGIEAQTVLTQSGFLIKEIYALDQSQPIGVVLAQAPAAGSTQPIGSQVTITVNKSN
jgi:serine/threonine-protein kinase